MTDFNKLQKHYLQLKRAENEIKKYPVLYKEVYEEIEKSSFKALGAMSSGLQSDALFAIADSILIKMLIKSYQPNI